MLISESLAYASEARVGLEDSLLMMWHSVLPLRHVLSCGSLTSSASFSHDLSLLVAEVRLHLHLGSSWVQEVPALSLSSPVVSLVRVIHLSSHHHIHAHTYTCVRVHTHT